MVRYLLALFILIALPARAEEIVLGLSAESVGITARFDGDDILIFGAVKRDAPPPDADGPLEVIVTVSGPLTPVMVRKRDRVFGIWVNAQRERINLAPSFYAAASTAPLAHILPPLVDEIYAITVPRAVYATGVPSDDADDFSAALIRIRESEGMYRTLEGDVALEEETLFRTRIALPANLTEGDYRARIFLLRGGRVIDTQETPIDVHKVGIERWLYTTAHEQPIFYGLLSLVLALVAGWGASEVFRQWQRR
ncbi:TIGR02186 family protein [Ketogulonicigenium robustum]|nr:TIGR02186 family protein [Ketogulonicigenium robustum]